jgi:hypothetical protein
MTTTNTNKSLTSTTTTPPATSGERTHGDANREGRENAERGGDTGGRAGGRAGGGQGGGGRGNNNQESGNDNVSTSSKYKGKTAELEEHSFHTHSENPKRTEFLTTLEAIKMYAAKQYKNQFIHMKEAIFEDFEEPTINPPDAVPSTATEMEKLIYIEDYKVWRQDEKELNNAVMTLFDVIVGQCSD